MSNPIYEKLLPAPINGGFKMEDYNIWCGSVIADEIGGFHMFASRWRKELGFGFQWLFNSEIVRAYSQNPEGPYEFKEVVLGRRERCYFDALNQHNPSIKYWNGTYFLYYFGATYGGPIPGTGDIVFNERIIEVWNNKRIGLATSKSLLGPWKRADRPILEPNSFGNWDCTITTNPSPVILEDGRTYMIYKSREYANATLKLGVAFAPNPGGPFVRLSDKPIFEFENPDFHVEDPFLWFEDNKFHVILKDDFKNNCCGITGECGAGIYATSNDCIHWEIAKDPKAYSRKVTWEDGSSTVQCNLERPNLLFQNGVPTHLFFATGKGKEPWSFDGVTWNMVIPLKTK